MNSTARKGDDEVVKPRSGPHIAKVERAATDILELIIDTWQLATLLEDNLWHRPPGSPEVVVMSSGHTDPTGDTVANSIHARNHLADAKTLIVDAAAKIRGANRILHDAAGTTPIDGNPNAPSVARKVKPCVNCRDLPGTRRGRCDACAQYHARTGTERPAHLWQQPHHK